MIENAMTKKEAERVLILMLRSFHPIEIYVSDFPYMEAIEVAIKTLHESEKVETERTELKQIAKTLEEIKDLLPRPRRPAWGGPG